ncbi:hypothetical protein [Serratia phage X20]|uniref:Uncharacterized protein n=3 Tax=Winklervirus TaxID=2560256 RepID=A0A1Z1LYV9_9CAUD|nr:thymidylate kinase [Serratia phage CHI14]YP_010092186.1 thymidylate kinase [Serratia phage X20]ARW57734.1 hypothetical protein [Serratia phage CBH8]QYN80481.1 hypothetical protein [Kosakonia phage Kc304]UJJ22018.1 hypothetical protein [Erwinia phage Virsaitis27]UYM28688.1 hypothetical protein [Serratia phage vB_SspM_LC53]ARW57459.1 hypothetical protein [Serratia phage CHI14]
MAKIIYVDGPDNAGKTSLIRDICEISDRYELIDFPKRTDDGRFDIKSRNEVACFETMLEYLDPKKIYLLDRGYISNWVYGMIRGELLKELDRFEVDFNRLVDNHKVYTLILTRNEMTSDFEDDLISLSPEGFNKVISLFEEFADNQDLPVHQILNHDGRNNIRGVNAGEHQAVISSIIKWAR